MTRKDYELIAAAIDRARASAIANTRHSRTARKAAIAATESCAGQLASALANASPVNPRFDHDRFWRAATDGPRYQAAINDEALARELGPCDSQATNTTDRHVKLAP